MRVNFLFMAVVCALTLGACQSDTKKTTEGDDNEQVNTEQETPVKMIEQLVGEWQLEASQDQSAGQEAGAGQRLTFTEEARYIAESADQKVDSGAFRMNEQLQNLYLESETNEQPREYEMDLQQDILTLKPKGNQGGQANASYTYRRATPGSISPQKRGEQ